MSSEPNPYWGDKHLPFVKIGTDEKELRDLADAIVRGSSIAHARIADLRAIIEAVQNHPKAKFRCDMETTSIDHTTVESTAIHVKGGYIERCECSELDIKVHLVAQTQFCANAYFDKATFREPAWFISATFGDGVNFKFARFNSVTTDGEVMFYTAKFGARATFAGAHFGVKTTFDGATLGDRASFVGVHFDKGATFAGTRFGGLASFASAKFGGPARFDEAIFGDEASFSQATFGEGTSFYSAKLPRASFEYAVLRRANFQLAEIGGIDVSGADLDGVRGLFGPHRATTPGQSIREHDVQTAHFHRKWDWIPWTLLRVIGALRLFGVSYGSIIVIVIYVKFAKWYNTSFAVQVREDAQQKINDGIDWRWREILATLPDLPVPGHLATQLIMILVLAIGATLYQLFCPDLVKEATETRWTRQMNAPLIEYRSAMWSRIVWRYLSALFFVAGGVYTVGYLSLRLWDALRYLFGQ